VERVQADDRRGATPEQGARLLVVAVMGLPGAGKSLVAGALERQLGLRRVCRDAIRQAMFPQCDYTFLEKRAAFRGLMLALEINCLLGASSVIDGMTFSRRQDYDQVAALAAAHGADLLPLLIDCPPDLARARVAQDLAAGRHAAADRDPALVTAVALRFEAPPAAALRIDARLPAADVCRLAVAEVAARLGRAA
jgi:predicted kinase